MKRRIAKKLAKREWQEARIAELLGSVPSLHHAIEEVAEDNLALMQAVKRTADSQEAIRTSLLEEMGQIRLDIAAELGSRSLRLYCHDLAPVLAALEGMVKRADFSDGETIRQHVESLALTLNSAMGRMGIDRIPIVAGADLFDSRIHECVRVCGPLDSPHAAAPSRTIVHVQEPGFLVRGRVAIPAKVWVQRTELEKTKPEKDGL